MEARSTLCGRMKMTETMDTPYIVGQGFSGLFWNCGAVWVDLLAGELAE